MSPALATTSNVQIHPAGLSQEQGFDKSLSALFVLVGKIATFSSALSQLYGA